MNRSCFLGFIAAVFASSGVGHVNAASPPPLYNLSVAPFQQGGDYGAVTGFNNSDQATYTKIAGFNFWWNGSQEILLQPTVPGSQATVFGLNDSGVAVGERAGIGGEIAMRWDQGVPHDLGTLGGASSSAGSINSLGTIAGWSQVADGSTHIFTWNNGFTDLGTPPSGASFVPAINNSNQVVGFERGGGENGWMYSNGHFISLPDLSGGNFSAPRDINDSGLVVGQSNANQNDPRPVTWTNGQIQALPEPAGASGGEARSVNEQNQIVGNVNLPDPSNPFMQKATLWDNGTPYILNSLVTNVGDWHLLYPEHINDRGQIEVLAFSFTQGRLRVILTPVPEPGSLCLAAIAISSAFFANRRSSRRRSKDAGCLEAIS